MGSIERHHIKVSEATCGDVIGFSVKNVSATEVQRGHVVGDDLNPASECQSFVAFIVVMKVPNSIEKGYQAVCDVHTAHIAVKFAELLQKVDRLTGQILEENPKALK